MPHIKFEDVIMNKLLSGKNDILEVFMKQYMKSRVISREFTSCGFLTYFDVPQSMALNHVSGKISDLRAEFIKYKGEYLSCTLSIKDGKFDVLECVTTLDRWRNDYRVKIEYCYEAVREFEINGQKIIAEQTIQNKSQSIPMFNIAI